MKKKVNFWKHKKENRIPIVKPKKITKEAKDLVKLGIGAGIGLAALGVGLAAYESVAGGE